MEKSNITSREIYITSDYIKEKGGILNTLTYVSATYIYKVFESFDKDSIKKFSDEKLKKIKRTIIHKDPHLDEYFAELLFRAILPPSLKDIEVMEHVLISKEEDSLAQISFIKGVVFGISSQETGGAVPLQIFDEHNKDGDRIAPSSSQLVIDDFFGNQIPSSIKKVLDEVNFSDAYSGAHQYHIKNIFFAMNEVFLLIGKDDIENKFVYKQLTENWKRALVNACITAFVYSYQNNYLLGFPNTWADDFKSKIELVARKSLERYLSKTYLTADRTQAYENVKNRILGHFNVWTKDNEFNKKGVRNRYFHETINGSFWRDKKTNEKIESQCLTIQPLCYALQKCWGNDIGDFIMSHIWQSIFQLQVAFEKIKSQITSLENFKQQDGMADYLEMDFGKIRRIDLKAVKFLPEKNKKDENFKDFETIEYFQIYEAVITNPYYSNVKQILSNILNEKNAGFGLIFIHNKIINSKAINKGSSVPYSIWKRLSDTIASIEPDCWFQLQPDGEYADFILNRTPSHQDILPSNLVDIELLHQIINQL